MRPKLSLLLVVAVMVVVPALAGDIRCECPDEELCVDCERLGTALAEAAGLQTDPEGEELEIVAKLKTCRVSRREFDVKIVGMIDERRDTSRQPGPSTPTDQIDQGTLDDTIEKYRELLGRCWLD